MKGIILAGGNGSRLYPITTSVSKQLLPVFDKPMIYYPLSTLLLSGLREIAVICRGQDLPLFERLLGDGSRFGVQITLLMQREPRGLPEAYVIAKEFLQGQASMMILGDNIFHGPGTGTSLRQHLQHSSGAHVFVSQVPNPREFGVLTPVGSKVLLEEKPTQPKGNLAITGLYVMDSSAPERAEALSPSKRGELEIVDLLSTYSDESRLTFTELPRGSVWLDAGTPKGLSEASEFVRVLQERQARKLSCPEEIAYNSGWISSSDLGRSIAGTPQGSYRTYLEGLEV